MTVVGGVLTAAIAVAGCTGGQVAAGSPSTTVGTSPVDTASYSAVPSQTQSTTTAQPAPPATSAVPVASSTPECKANSLALSFGTGDAGMSQQERVLRFTNTGHGPCVIVGFPGVSYVTGDNGQQVGAPATRTGSIGARITLDPGQVASTVIHSVDAEVFDQSACKPVPVRGYRVYAPDDTAAMFIPFTGQGQTEGCTTDEGLLSVYTVKAGLGDPDQP